MNGPDALPLAADANDFAFERDGARVDAATFYRIACDPRRPVVVEACAGAGKTWMLVSRILRALLDSAEPQSILAITFTKKAAGEMRARLADWLGHYARCDAAERVQALVDRGLTRADADAMQAALGGLHARLLALGRPVQIRTFHSWFAALLKTAPLSLTRSLGLPAHHELLEDDARAVAAVWRRFHARVADEPARRADFEALVHAHGRLATQSALGAALARRVEVEMADESGVLEESVRPFTDRWPEWAGRHSPAAALLDAAVQARWLAWAKALGTDPLATPRKAADAIAEALQSTAPGARLAALRKALFIKEEDRLSAHLQKYAAAQAAGAELHRLLAAEAQHDAWLHHGRVMRLARVLIVEFAALKRERGWVDMNDLERAALKMLSDPVLSGWIQERLDARIRHLLVDEFQDTNPMQWQTLSNWLAGYAGAGGDPPGVFIVGDPKQSIFRFRRAEPQVFLAAQAFVADGLGGTRLSCNHTRRNAPAVLAVVNTVMSQASTHREFDGFLVHTTASSRDGRVGALPQILRPAKAESRAQAEPAPWRDSLAEPRQIAEERLAALECRQVAAWIAGEIAAGAEPAEFMVLSRKRERLHILEAELRELGVPSRQPAKIDLGEASEVQDVIALLDALVSPTHDLSLARALRSPIFGITDDSLVAIAAALRGCKEAALKESGAVRGLSWFELLEAPGAAPSSELEGVGRTLARWREWVRTLSPHDAIDAIYHDGDLLARFAAAAAPALREPVLANLRALVGAALEIDGGRYLTPYAFVRAIKAGRAKVPLSAAEDAVQLLTVHGAKGLEADTVVLLDTDPRPSPPETMAAVVDWPGEAPAPRRLAFIAHTVRPPACCEDWMRAEQAARSREELNALYVALTRARGRLVLSSVEPYAPGAGGRSWWRRVQPYLLALDAPVRPPRIADVSETSFSMRIVPGAQEKWASDAMK